MDAESGSPQAGWPRLPKALIVAWSRSCHQLRQWLIEPGQTMRLKEQIRQLDQGRRLACTVGVFYFSHRYAALSLSTAAGILALSSLALISKQG